ncbi:hypothetical protein A3J56_01705 [Candidatus Giovannonibacteria bacterium RIFCSPHIGHO2_02_FULL_46_20]|uniref:N-acetyltransferase domain-containing protein n=1 Tax=Candidatus Giovannonibacteria bacterium RIFCSPHIGHO2_02_FULL_46_20 TaxID=1798338 RepID=A0A1F5WEI6_9BACT|nr:MAG: hypothetical protein A3J56_01705 [Candidatus Giovannonibacteria bacterium RIFCSPHIGHO2_02_FULL_46_20]
MKRFDAIFVLGGRLVQNVDGSWRTTNFEERDQKNAFGDRLRVCAAPYLLKTFQDTNTAPIIIVSGSAGKLVDKGAPPVAVVMAHELEELGVSHDRILQETESNSTYEQLQALIVLMKKRGWHRVMIFSNRWHLDRVRAMIVHAQPLSCLTELLNSGDIVLESAEEVLCIHAKDEWKKTIDSAYKTRHMQEIVAAEQKGVQDIEAGKYQFSFLRLRKAMITDSDFLFNLRNEESVRAASWSTDPIPFETHQAWMSRLLANSNRELFVAEAEGVPAGQIHYDFDDASTFAEVGISFSRKYRGKGFGSEALQRTATVVFSNHPLVTTLYAHIKPDNAGSAGSFAKAGYQKTNKTEYEGHPCIEMTKTR